MNTTPQHAQDNQDTQDTQDTQATQVALVTGANRGIGRAIARGLGERGFQVWIGSRDETAARETADDLGGDGIDARAVQLDVTSQQSIRAAVETVEGQTHALDVLVNNAGINFGPPGDPSTESIEDVAAMFDTNTFGPLRVTQAFLPLLRRAAVGRVVMATSGLGSQAGTLDLSHENWGVAFAGYSASKTALNMLTIKLAKELLT